MDTESTFAAVCGLAIITLCQHNKLCVGDGSQPEAFLQLFDKHKLDVVCLQEITGRYLDQMSECAAALLVLRKLR